MAERMTKIRIELLSIIANVGDKEINYIGLSHYSNKKINIVEKAVSFFANRKYIIFTGGGFFRITNEGIGYLKSLN